MRQTSSVILIGLFLLAMTTHTAKGQEARNGSGRPEGPSLLAATAAFKAGSEAFEHGDLSRAQKSFEEAVRLAPKVAPAHTALGAVLLASGQLPQAEAELKAALQLDPADQVALLDLAIVQSREHKDDASVASLEKLKALDPQLNGADSAAAAVPLAAALSRAGHMAEAEALLRRAVAVKFDDAPLADALGTVEAAQGRYDDARAELGRAVALDDTLAAAHFHLGSVDLQLRQPQSAVPELERAHRLEPMNSAYTLQLAKALDQTGAEPEVVTLLQSALQTSPAGEPATEMRYRLALALQNEGQPNEAIPLFAAVVADRPRDVDALINTGLAHVQTGDAIGGITLYQRALALASPTPTLHEDLGVAYLQQGDLKQALEQFRAGLTLDADNPQLHYDLGLALKLKDDLAAAVPEFEQAARLDPTLPDPPYTLGVIYMQQGHFAEAAGMLVKATELRPENGNAWATLGSVLHSAGDAPKAEAALRRAISLLPEQPGPHINLASVLMEEGKKDEAIAERKRAAELTRIADSRQRADFGIRSGAALLQQGKVAEALQQYQDAVQAAPSDATAHAGLATALERAGRKAEAAEERRKASGLAPAAKPQ